MSMEVLPTDFWSNVTFKLYRITQLLTASTDNQLIHGFMNLYRLCEFCDTDPQKRVELTPEVLKEYESAIMDDSETTIWVRRLGTESLYHAQGVLDLPLQTDIFPEFRNYKEVFQTTKNKYVAGHVALNDLQYVEKRVPGADVFSCPGIVMKIYECKAYGSDGSGFDFYMDCPILKDGGRCDKCKAGKLVETREKSFFEGGEIHKLVTVAWKRAMRPAMFLEIEILRALSETGISGVGIDEIEKAIASQTSWQDNYSAYEEPGKETSQILSGDPGETGQTEDVFAEPDVLNWEDE